MTEPNDTGAETEGDKADIVERRKETERWLFRGRKSERKSMRSRWWPGYALGRWCCGGWDRGVWIAVDPCGLWLCPISAERDP